METPELLPPGDLARALIEAAPDGVLAFDRARRLTAWNPALARLTGIGAAAALGRDVLAVLPWLRGAGGERRLRATLAGASPVSRGRAFHAPGGTGRGIHLEAHYQPVRGDDGAVVGGLVLIRAPTTAAKPAERSRRRAEEELREREARLRGVVDNLPGVV